jgi:hypothetical protein
MLLAKSVVFPVLLLNVDVVGKVVLLSVVVVDPLDDAPLLSVVDPPLDVSLLLSADPLAYLIAVEGKINEITIKSTNKLVIRFNVPFIMLLYKKSLLYW